MEEYVYTSLRARPELRKAAAEWFHKKWGVPEEAYLECMEACLAGASRYDWYLCLCGGDIVGGLGVIENDFHERRDLAPNVCAVYTESAHRSKGIAGRLLGMAVEGMRAEGLSPVYLLTDLDGFYERYGWEYLCMAKCDDGGELKVYLHK